MNSIVLTETLARASATDAGNMSMRKAGRTKWNRTDWNAMCATFYRLLPYCEDVPETLRRRLA